MRRTIQALWSALDVNERTQAFERKKKKKYKTEYDDAGTGWLHHIRQEMAQKMQSDCIKDIGLAMVSLPIRVDSVSKGSR